MVAALALVTQASFARAETDEATNGEVTAKEGKGEEEAAGEKTVPSEEQSSAEAGGGAMTSEAGEDGGRFRFGVAAGAGSLSADNIDMTYYGVDLRFGWQVNDALGVVATPQLGYYKLDGASALFGSGGLIGTSVDADYTLFDRLFVGAGLGYAILNNPSGTELHLRAGGYPLVSRSDEKIRRKGLMLGIDFRVHFVEGYTFVAPTFNLGYESF
jgi:hypothetical protein